MRNRVFTIILALALAAALVVMFINGNGSAAGQDVGTEAALSSVVLINEAMASNSGAVPDDEGNFSDWIELYNPTAEEINISGWGLSDDPLTAAKWAFPAKTTIPAGGYLLVYCSGREDASSGGALHANFKINSSETITLSDSSGSPVDRLALTEVAQNSSIGRQADNLDEWASFELPTPGFENTPAGRAAYDKTMDASSIGVIINEFQPSNKTTLPSASGQYTIGSNSITPPPKQ